MPARKTSPSKKPSGKAAPRKAAKRPAAKPARKAPAKEARPAAPRIRHGYVSHTELASADPAATKLWCTQVLGWSFGPPMPIPGGEYHMWKHDEGSGGGIRSNNPPEAPGTIPYVEVSDIRATFAKALKAGGKEMVAPMEVPGSGGWIAVVAAPGGVPIGLWGTK